MNAREALYPNFSRNIGNPWQKPISNMQELNHFISLNSGYTDDCYASICSYQSQQPIFEDLFLETDTPNIASIISVAQWYQSHNIPFITLFSGNRGYHIHALFEPEIVQPQTVKKFAEQIVKDTKNEGNFDAHVIGNIRQMARIPNTKRLNGLWCIPLSQETIFSNPPIETILSYAKSPQFIEYNLKKRPRITEFVQDSKAEEYHHTLTSTPKETFFLKDILRPCIYDKLCVPNPKHQIRITATIELLNQGISTPQILDCYQQLNWIDFDKSYSRMQIEFIQDKLQKGEISPYGKKKLGCTKKGTCLQCILRS